MPEKHHVMIVDDDEATRYFLKELLESNGCETSEADSGVRCLEMLRSMRPDLILLDVNMPAPGGLEVCRMLKGDGLISDIPVVFITALDDLQDVLQGYEAGALDYITKPINRMTTLARVNAILNHQQLLKDKLNLLNANMALLSNVEAFLRKIALEPKIIRIKREVTESITLIFDLLETIRGQMKASLAMPTAGERITTALEKTMALLDEAQGNLQFGDRVVQQFNEVLKTVSRINTIVSSEPELDPAMVRASTQFVLREKPSQSDIDELLASINTLQKK